MPETSKLISATAPSGPPSARRPALSGDCGDAGALVKTVVSATAVRLSGVVPATPAPRFGSMPAAVAPLSAGGAPGASTAEGGKLTAGGGNGAPGPVVTTGAVSG